MKNDHQTNKLNDDLLKKRLVDWLVKIKFLKDQIAKLEQLENFVIISVTVFLLKSQLIEFELKQLIFSLDLHLYSQNRSSLVSRRVRTPRDLDKDKLTLGQLVGKLNEFITPFEPLIDVRKVVNQGKNVFLNELKQNLELLLKKRNEFSHKLFSIGQDVSKLTDEAQEGIQIANKTLKLIEDLEIELKNYDK